MVPKLRLARRNTLDEVMAAQSLLNQKKTEQGKLKLAKILLENDIPRGCGILYVDYPEETNADGSFDIVLSDVLNANDEVIADLGNIGGLPMGIYAGEEYVTAVDEFIVWGYIDTNRVYDFIDSLK